MTKETIHKGPVHTHAHTTHSHTAHIDLIEGSKGIACCSPSARLHWALESEADEMILASLSLRWRPPLHTRSNSPAPGAFHPWQWRFRKVIEILRQLSDQSLPLRALYVCDRLELAADAIDAAADRWYLYNNNARIVSIESQQRYQQQNQQKYKMKHLLHSCTYKWRRHLLHGLPRHACEPGVLHYVRGRKATSIRRAAKPPSRLAKQAVQGVDTRAGEMRNAICGEDESLFVVNDFAARRDGIVGIEGGVS